MTQSEIHAQFHRFQINRERQWAPKVYEVLNNQLKQYAAHYPDNNALYDISSAQMYRLIKAIRIDGATIYGSKVSAYLPNVKRTPQRPGAMKGISFKSRPVIGHNQRMIDLVNLYFDQEILKTAEGITDTTREEIQRILKQANAEGRGITWIVTQMENINKSRAKLIARTETVTAANAGGFLAALDVGILMQKQWLATNDDRTRHDHAVENGTRVNITDYFQVGDATMLYPGDRTQQNGMETPANEVCNCRCTVQYIPVRIDGKLVPFDYSQFRALVG